jgi:nucleosome binding factor SPN SPT16 subunit
MAEESIFNSETVIQRVAKVRNQWLANKSHPKSWKDADALVLVQGKFGEDVYHKPRIYQQYLLNYELSLTIMLLTKDHLTILTSAKKAAAFEKDCGAVFGDSVTGGSLGLTVLVKDKSDGYAANFAALMSAAKKRGQCHP